MLIMKYLAAFFFLLFLSVRPCSATHDLQYFIYVQDEYVQGPWRHAENVVEYLRPITFTELFGSEPLDVPLSVFKHLAVNRPDDYQWERQLHVAGDTLMIDVGGAIPNFDRVRNEVTLSMTSQSVFRHVRFRSADRDVTFSEEDVELPYFELVFPNRSAASVDDTPGPADSSANTTSTEPDISAQTQETDDVRDFLFESDFIREQQNKQNAPGLSLWIGFGGMLVAGALGFGLGKVVGKR